MKTDDMDLQRRRELAAKVNCITREDFCVLADITDGTEEAWRKRGKAPAHIVLGRSILYPVDGLSADLEARVRHPRARVMKDTL